MASLSKTNSAKNELVFTLTHMFDAVAQIVFQSFSPDFVLIVPNDGDGDSIDASFIGNLQQHLSFECGGKLN